MSKRSLERKFYEGHYHAYLQAERLVRLTTAEDGSVRRIDMIHIGHRFMTGQVCTTTGGYEFDGYTDTSTLPTLTDDDRQITLNAGKHFPPASLDAKSAYWRFTGVN